MEIMLCISLQIIKDRVGGIKNFQMILVQHLVMVIKIMQLRQKRTQLDY
jgi:hypothetical protein